MLFNGILSMVTLLNMYSAVAQVESTAVIQYSSFMDMYEFVTTIEFILLMFIVPAVTAASISGERERQTLELMLTTQMTASQVVIGKLMSALSTLLLLIVSSFPAVAMVFVYGGITWQDILSLLMCYITVAFFCGKPGNLFLSPVQAVNHIHGSSYGVLIAVVAGTYFINKFSLSLSSMNINNSVAAYGFGENVVKPSSGNVIYLLLINPAATFYTIINGQMGGSAPTAKMAGYFGMQSTGFVMENWIIISIVIQLSIAALMIWVAIKQWSRLSAGADRRRQLRKGINHGNH